MTITIPETYTAAVIRQKGGPSSLSLRCSQLIYLL